jgi:hypothetical protein
MAPIGLFDALRSLWAGPLFALLLAQGPAAPPSMPSMRVRAVTPELRSVIADTMQRSRTVRELVARLSCSDVIVYVEITGSPQIPTARTKLVVAAGEARFLRIGLNAGLPLGALGPLLAHELQHAVEIAEHDEVRDEAALRRLYERIGRAHGNDAYETAAAQEVETLVRQELRHRIGG